MIAAVKVQAADYELQAHQYIAGLQSGQGSWLTEQRNQAALRISELGLPERRQEEWRYTSVDKLLQQQFRADDSQTEMVRDQISPLFLPEVVAARLVFVDGSYQPLLSSINDDAVQFSNLQQLIQENDEEQLKAIGRISGQAQHAFSAMNLATLHDGAILRIKAGTKLQQPIELLHVCSSAAKQRSLRSRHLISIEANASVSLVERYLCLDNTTGYFNNLVCEIEMGEHASLRHQRVQDESLQAFHLCDIHLAMQAGAHYQGVNAAVGASWSRTTIHNVFTAAGANCELDGLYLAGDAQLVDFHLDIDHAVPGCDSRENFKGILYGAGRAVFDGLIRVQKQAQKTAAHLTNDNLMLSRQAEIDTKPQLVILADDVQCSHGTTVGQLDAQALFYMRSRGLTESQARRLLSVGFAVEILEQFDSDSLREQLTQLIHERVSTSTNG